MIHDEDVRALDRDHGWNTSSFTGAGENCVEVNVRPSVVGVRDSKSRTSGRLVFPSGRWHALLDIAREGHVHP